MRNIVIARMKALLLKALGRIELGRLVPAIWLVVALFAFYVWICAAKVQQVYWDFVFSTRIRLVAEAVQIHWLAFTPISDPDRALESLCISPGFTNGLARVLQSFGIRRAELWSPDRQRLVWSWELKPEGHSEASRILNRKSKSYGFPTAMAGYGKAVGYLVGWVDVPGFLTYGKTASIFFLIWLVGVLTIIILNHRFQNIRVSLKRPVFVVSPSLVFFGLLLSGLLVTGELAWFAFCSGRLNQALIWGEYAVRCRDRLLERGGELAASAREIAAFVRASEEVTEEEWNEFISMFRRRSWLSSCRLWGASEAAQEGSRWEVVAQFLASAEAQAFEADPRALGLSSLPQRRALFKVDPGSGGRLLVLYRCPVRTRFTLKGRSVSIDTLVVELEVKTAAFMAAVVRDEPFLTARLEFMYGTGGIGHEGLDEPSGYLVGLSWIPILLSEPPYGVSVWPASGWFAYTAWGDWKWVLAIGAVGSLFGSSAAFYGSRYSRRLAAEVEARCRELAETKRAAEIDRSLMEAVLSSLIDRIMVVSPDFGVKYANRGTWQAYGKDVEVGQAKCYEVMTSRSEPCEGCPLQEVMAEQRGKRWSSTFIDERGEPHYELVWFHPFADPQTGKVIGVVEVRRDVTEVLSAEAEVERLSQQKDQLIRVINHELRTPLQVVLTSLEELGDSLLNYEQQALVRSCRSALRTIERLTKDLAYFQRQDRERVEIEHKGFWVRHAIEETVYGCAGLRKGDEVRVCTAFWGPELWAVGDETRIRQIVTNLVNNAISYTPKGEVRVQAWIAPHDGGMGEMKWDLNVLVSDEGIGMTEQELQAVFREFYRGEAARGLRPSGVGLGLFIVKRLIDAMGGSIWVDSKPGEGSRFWARLPVEITSEGAQTNKERLLDWCRCLLVEPHLLTRLCLKERLVEWGAEVDDMGQWSDQAYYQQAVDLVILSPGLLDNELMCALRAAAKRKQPWLWLTEFEELPCQLDGVIDLPLVSANVFDILQSLVCKDWGKARGGILERQPELRLSLRILLVEDDAAARAILARMLRRAGCDCVGVATGLEARKLLEQQAVDLVILDLLLPDINGLELARQIRQGELGAKNQQVPIVVLSGQPLEAELVSLVGINEVLEKPVSFETLIRVLSSYQKERPKAVQAQTDKD